MKSMAKSILPPVILEGVRSAVRGPFWPTYSLAKDKSVAAPETEEPALDGYDDCRALAEEMFKQKQIARVPVSTDPAFLPVDGPRWNAIRAANAQIQSMFWGPRIFLDDACAKIRAWIASTLE